MDYLNLPGCLNESYLNTISVSATYLQNIASVIVYRVKQAAYCILACILSYNSKESTRGKHIVLCKNFN